MRVSIYCGKFFVEHFKCHIKQMSEEFEVLSLPDFSLNLVLDVCSLRREGGRMKFC